MLDTLHLWQNTAHVNVLLLEPGKTITRDLSPTFHIMEIMAESDTLTSKQYFEVCVLCPVIQTCQCRHYCVSPSLSPKHIVDMEQSTERLYLQQNYMESVLCHTNSGYSILIYLYY